VLIPVSLEIPAGPFEILPPQGESQISDMSHISHSASWNPEIRPGKAATQGIG